MSDFGIMLSIMSKTYDDFMKIDNVGALGAIFASILDKWCADKDVSTEDANDMLLNLVVMHRETNKVFGRMPKTDTEE